MFRDVFEAWRYKRARRDVDYGDWRHRYKLAINTGTEGDEGHVRVGASLVT
jgi:hypothetical protein